MTLQLRNSNKAGRNDPCICGSGLKHKWCHGDELKKATCMDIANRAMAELVFRERVKGGIICEHNVLVSEHCKDCEIGD